MRFLRGNIDALGRSLQRGHSDGEFDPCLHSGRRWDPLVAGYLLYAVAAVLFMCPASSPASESSAPASREVTPKANPGGNEQGPSSHAKPTEVATSGERLGKIDYAEYAAVLAKYVNDRGMVKYSELKMHRAKLDAFVAMLGNLDPATYNALSENGKIAFWINAYNAFTLKAIIDHYPIHSSFLTSLRYPKNSIRQISGVWNGLKFTVMGKPMTLDHIEHQILRKKFHEPRIHMALVCAAMGCPPLRNKPYTGAKLEEQLENQARKFLVNPKKFRIDRANGEVYLSSIFKWFGDDFIPKYEPEKGFRDKSKKERAVLHFIAGHLTEKDADYLRSGKYDVEYLDYDWTLNEQ